MRKILTLLALLVTTVTAMATDYTGAVTYKAAGMSGSFDKRTLVVEDNGDGTYNVTLKDFDATGTLGSNLGDFKCTNVAGTTSNGVTTIDVSSCTTSASGLALKFVASKFVTKFNGEKAYAQWTGKANNSIAVEYTFGTDDFNTGGGTGGGETPSANVKVVKDGMYVDGATFNYPFTCNLEKQKLVAKLNLATCHENQLNENLFSISRHEAQISNWPCTEGGVLHLYYTRYGNNWTGSKWEWQTKRLVCHYLMEDNTKTTHEVTIENPDEVTFELTKDGFYVEGNLLFPASELADLYAGTDFFFGSLQGENRSWATYNSVEVQNLDNGGTVDPKPTFPTPASDATQYSDNFKAVAGGWTMGTVAATAYVSLGEGTADIQINKANFADVQKKINVAGVKVAEEDGYTVFSGSDIVLLDEDCNEFKANVTGKAKDNKLYLVISTNDEIFGWGGAEFTFGDDNFPTDPVNPTEVTVAENYQTTQGEPWKFDTKIDWDTQKLVVSVNLADAADDKGCLGVTVKGQNPDWVDNGIIFYNNNSSTVQGFVPGTSNNSNTGYVTKGSDPVRFEISKADGVKCQGDVVIPASSLSVLTANSDIVVGVYGNKIAGALYNYIKVVPLDWTEQPETPFEPKTLTKTDAANTTFNGTTTNFDEKTVEVNEYEEGKYKVTYKDLTVGSNRLGDFTIDNVSATTVDGVTTLTTTDTKGTWSNKNESAIVGFLIPDATSAISDFAASYTLTDDGQIDKLNLSFNFTVSDGTVNAVFGKKAEISKTYTATFYAVNKASGDTQELNAAQITVVDKNDGTYEFTIPSFNDPDGDEVGSITFLANGTTEDGKTTFTANDVDVALTGDWSTYHASVSMNGTLAYEQLTATFVVELGGLGDDYTYTLGFGVKPFTPTTKSVTDCANIKIGDKTENFDNVTLESTENPEDVYAITYKNFTVNGNEIGDLTIKNVTSNVDESTQVATLSTTATVATWTRVVENNAAGFNHGDEVAIRNFTGTVTPASNGGGVIVPGGGDNGSVVSADETEENDKVLVKFDVQLTGEWASVTFGEKAPEEEPIEGTVVEGSKNFQANGSSFEWTNIPINWDKQKLVAVIDLSTCGNYTTNENILSVGENVGSWTIGGWHWYYTKSSTRLKSDYLTTGGAHPVSDEKTNVEATTLRIELSKENGCTVNGEDANGLYIGVTGDWRDLTSDFWTTTSVNIGSKEGANRSYATIKYVSVVDLPAQPEATTYDGQLQIIDGMTEDDVVKMDEAQVVITKNADGQTGSISFKNVTFGEQTGDLTFVGTLVESTEDGESFVTMQDGTSDEATTTLLGKEVVFGGSGQYLEGGDIQMTFEFYSEDESLYYVGQFGNLWTAINGINADAAAGNTQIFTVNGTRVNALQKGINIVRTADGKTVKVLK